MGRVRRVYEAVRSSKLVIYANPDDEVRSRVLHKVCELANLLGVKCLYVNAINLIKAFREDYDKVLETALDELTHSDSSLVVLDSFELYLFIERFRLKFIQCLKSLLETERRAVLGTTPESLNDDRVCVVRDQLSPIIIVDIEEPAPRRVQRGVMSLFRKFISLMSKTGDEESVFIA